MNDLFRRFPPRFQQYTLVISASILQPRSTAAKQIQWLDPPLYHRHLFLPLSCSLSLSTPSPHPPLPLRRNLPGVLSPSEKKSVRLCLCLCVRDCLCRSRCAHVKERLCDVCVCLCLCLCVRDCLCLSRCAPVRQRLCGCVIGALSEGPSFFRQVHPS